MTINGWLVFSIFVLAVSMMLLIERILRFRKKGQSTAPVWAASLVFGSVLITFLFIHAVVCALFFPNKWQSGVHIFPSLVESNSILLFDPIIFGGLAKLSLLLPCLFWLFPLIINNFYQTKTTQWFINKTRFLTGNSPARGVKNRANRNWIWILILIPGLISLFTAPLLVNKFRPPYPPFLWSAQIWIIFTLLAIYLAKPLDQLILITTVKKVSKSVKVPWETWMDQQGIKLTKIGSCKQGKISNPELTDLGSRLLGQIRQESMRRIIPANLANACGALLQVGMPNIDSDQFKKLIIGADNCGQLECISVVANSMKKRFNTITLILTAKPDYQLKQRINNFYQTIGIGRGQVELLTKGMELNRDVSIYLVDLATLSDSLLEKLRPEKQINLVGMLCWWNITSFSGSIGANAWLISRRVRRLFNANGRRDLRLVATMNDPGGKEAQASEFVAQLLEDFSVSSRVNVNAQSEKNIHFYFVDQVNEFIRSQQFKTEPPKTTAVMTALASCISDWPTRVELANTITANEYQIFVENINDLRRQLGKSESTSNGAAAKTEDIQGLVESDHSSACVRVIQLTEDNVITLQQLVNNETHAYQHPDVYVVLVRSQFNPYVNWLAQKLITDIQNNQRPPTRKLVCAQSQPKRISHHLELAIFEKPDRLGSLTAAFSHRSKLVKETLENLQKISPIVSTQVAFIQDGKLVIDQHYESRSKSNIDSLPLNTTTSRLSGVKDKNALSNSTNEYVLKVDEVRMSICAYPYKTFIANGERFQIDREQISSTTNQEDIKNDLFCQKQNRILISFRNYNAIINELRLSDVASFNSHKNNTSIYYARGDCQYSETLLGVKHFDQSIDTTGKPKLPISLDDEDPVHTIINDCQMYWLGLPSVETEEQIVSLAKTLLLVLRVHLGVEDDALSVVPYLKPITDHQINYSLILVDLFEGGVGIIPSVDEPSFILEILQLCLDWLNQCECQSDQGCVQCIANPIAESMNMAVTPSRKSAIELLENTL